MSYTPMSSEEIQKMLDSLPEPSTPMCLWVEPDAPMYYVDNAGRRWKVGIAKGVTYKQYAGLAL
jgi:hypothetical protein